ncbi:MAG: hypothetical protein IJU39_00705 [Clostridia bacterium]|nr:hypothetical protein [Clostridia bacterium]
MKLNINQKKRLIIVLSAAIAALAIVVGTVCLIAVKASKSSIRGEWKSKGNVSYVFQKKDMLTAGFDKAPLPVLETEYSGELAGDYSINKSDKTLSITLNYYNKKLTQKYSYEIKNGILALKNLEDGTSTVFYKQKTKK